MADETETQTPEEQKQTPPQPVGEDPGQQPPGAPQGFVEKARFDGLVRKVEELTLANRALEGDLADKTSQIEQLKGQLTVKDTEKQVAVGERDKQLGDVVAENTRLKSELQELQALQLKVKVAREMGRPDLITILDSIPAIEDEEALRTVMANFTEYADRQVKQREEQLLSGLTDLESPPAATQAAPSSRDAWIEHIESFTLGTPERQKALNDYGAWLKANSAN
jgi:chromosome segregation ATPase